MCSISFCRVELQPTTTISFTCTESIASGIEMAAETCLLNQCTEYITEISFSYSNCTTQNNIAISGGVSVVNEGTIVYDPVETDTCVNSVLESDLCKELFLVVLPNLSSMKFASQYLPETSVPSMTPLLSTPNSPSRSRPPSVAPSPNATAIAPDSLSNAPTAIVSASPSVSTKPSPLVHIPSKKPTRAPIVTPTISATELPIATQNVNVDIDNVQISFKGVGTISLTDLSTLQSIMEEWFEAYFNDEVAASEQRYLREEPYHRRMLQHLPAIQNMKTVVDVTTQDTSTTSGSNTITYTQNLNYDAASDAREPEDYVLLPFVDTTYNSELLDKLKSDVASFADLATLSTPIIAESLEGERGGLSLSIIISIVSGVVIIFLLFVIGAGYRHFLLVNNEKKRQSVSTNNINSASTGSDTVIDHGEIMNEHQGAICTMQLPAFSATIDSNHPVLDPPAQSIAHILTYKDQSRSVVCPNPIVHAVPDPKNLYNDNSILPIASAVQLSTFQPPSANHA